MAPLFEKKHQFAFFWPELELTIARIGSDATRPIIIENISLYHRIIRVLRLRSGQQIILFDTTCHAVCELRGSEEKNSRMHFSLLWHAANALYKPTITFLLPLLKGDALHEAVYGLVESGVSAIQLIQTQKVQNNRFTAKELGKLQTIMIAAAEQAKYYALPQLCEPQPLDKVIERYATAPQSKIIFFDPQGKALLPALNELFNDHCAKNLVLLIGPEAGLTIDEKLFLQQNSVDSYALTPTILRAQQAAILATGMVRSVLFQ